MEYTLYVSQGFSFLSFSLVSQFPGQAASCWLLVSFSSYLSSHIYIQAYVWALCPIYWPIYLFLAPVHHYFCDLGFVICFYIRGQPTFLFMFFKLNLASQKHLFLQINFEVSLFPCFSEKENLIIFVKVVLNLSIKWENWCLYSIILNCLILKHRIFFTYSDHFWCPLLIF